MDYYHTDEREGTHSLFHVNQAKRKRKRKNVKIACLIEEKQKETVNMGNTLWESLTLLVIMTHILVVVTTSSAPSATVALVAPILGRAPAHPTCQRGKNDTKSRHLPTIVYPFLSHAPSYTNNWKFRNIQRKCKHKISAINFSILVLLYLWAKYEHVKM